MLAMGLCNVALSIAARTTSQPTSPMLQRVVLKVDKKNKPAINIKNAYVTTCRSQGWQGKQVSHQIQTMPMLHRVVRKAKTKQASKQQLTNKPVFQ